MKKIFQKALSLNILFILIIFSEKIHATRMPGIGDYAGLISLTGVIAGSVFATFTVLIVFLLSRNKNRSRKYFKIWIYIFIGTPVVLLALFFILLLIFSL